MKMGTTPSLWRYDVGAYDKPLLAENAKAYDYALRSVTAMRARTSSHDVPNLRSRQSAEWRKYRNKRPNFAISGFFSYGPDSVLIMRRRRRPVFLRDRKDTACGAVARPMRYFDLAAKVVGPPGQGR